MQLEVIRILLGLLLTLFLLALWLVRSRRWTDPLFLYVSFSTLLYFAYAFSGVQFYNGTSLSGEVFFVAALVVSCVGYALVDRRFSTEHHGVDEPDPAFLASIVYVLMVPMLLSLGVLLGILTGGNLMQLLDLSYGNALKWLRITERSPVVWVSEAVFLAAIGIVLPASVLQLGQKRKLAMVVTLIAFTLYLLSTGSRSPVVGAVLMVLAPVAELRRRGIYTSSIRRVFISIVVAVLTLFITVSLSRDQAEDNSNDMLAAVFNAKSLGFVAKENILPYSLQLPAKIIIIYFASTFNNYLIAFEQSASMDKAWGYRLFYTESKALGVVFPMDPGRSETILDENTKTLRFISPTGDQWATNLGTLLLEFGAPLALAASFVQGVAMGWLVRLSRRLEPNRRVMIESLLIPFAISGVLVHPLNSFSTHIQLLMLLTMVALALCRRRSRTSSLIPLPDNAVEV